MLSAVYCKDEILVARTALDTKAWEVKIKQPKHAMEIGTQILIV